MAWSKLTDIGAFEGLVHNTDLETPQTSEYIAQRSLKPWTSESSLGISFLLSFTFINLQR